MCVCAFVCILFVYLFLGYGFVDFECPAYAEGAVKGLQAKGVQAQMAKVGVWVLHRPAIVRLFACKYCFNQLTQN